MITLSPDERLDLLDLPAAAALWRAAVEVALYRALGGKADPVPAAALNKWLETGRATGPGARAALDRAAQRLLFADPPKESATWSQVARHVTPRGLERLTAFWADLPFNRKAPPGPPEALLLFTGLVRTVAADPTLHLALSQRLRAMFETRVLFHPEAPPVVTLSWVTHLVLVARSGALTGLSAPARAFLDALATAMIDTPEWADFWDLWLISGAIASGAITWPEAATALPDWAGTPPEAEVSEDDAPDIDDGDDSGTPDTTPQPDKRVLADWEIRRPVYCLAYRNGLL